MQKKKQEHITPIFASLHWLPVRFMNDFKILSFNFKGLYGLAPHISDLLPPYSAPRSLRSSTQTFLSVPRSRLKQKGLCCPETVEQTASLHQVCTIYLHLQISLHFPCFSFHMKFFVVIIAVALCIIITVLCIFFVFYFFTYTVISNCTALWLILNVRYK